LTVTALIINLPAAVERRTMQDAQFARLGIVHRFLNATAVADIPTADLARLERAWCRPLRPAEVACALSHRRAWADVAAGAAPVLILEDDVVLASDTAAVIGALSRRPDLECVTLETFTLPKVLGDPRPMGLEPFRLAEVYRDSGGAAAYMLWPSGARKLLAGRPGLLPLADAAINLGPGLRKHQVEPACAIQAMFLAGVGEIAPEVYQTTVSDPERLPITGLADWLRYRLRRLRVSLILFVRQMRGLGRSGKREIAFRGKG
jgi:glycosyl transferase family 25